jgi:hypothetical protein
MEEFSHLCQIKYRKMPGFWQKSAKYQPPEDFSICLVMEIVYLASCREVVQYPHVSSQGVSSLNIRILP